MDKTNIILQEVYESYGEWLEYDHDGAMLISILCALLGRERDKAEMYKMDLKRCELMRR